MAKLRRGELARASGVNAETLRFYERRGILPPPPRTASGYRLYEPEEAVRLRFIQRLQQLGYSMAEVEEILALDGSPASAARVQAAITGVDSRLADLRRLAERLSQASLGREGEPAGAPTEIWSCLESRQWSHVIPAKQVKTMNGQTETIRIEGMSCGHCVRAVREALEETEGVKVEDVQIGTARISYDPSRTPREKVAHAIEEAGFALAE